MKRSKDQQNIQNSKNQRYYLFTKFIPYKSFQIEKKIVADETIRLRKILDDLTRDNDRFHGQEE